MAWIEKEGIPTVGVICEGFDGSAHLVAENEGLSNARIVVYPPPNVLVQNSEEIYKYAETILDEVIKLLTEPVTEAIRAVIKAEMPEPREIIFRGTLEEVNEFFRETRRTDGLPIIPPSIEKVEQLRKDRDDQKVKIALRDIKEAAKEEVNLIPQVLEAVKVYATGGEIIDELREVYGVYERPVY